MASRAARSKLVLAAALLATSLAILRGCGYDDHPLFSGDPFNLRISLTERGSPLLRWDPYPHQIFEKYRLYHRMDGGSWGILVELGSSRTSYVHNVQVEPGVSYGYRISIVRGYGDTFEESSASDPVQYPVVPDGGTTVEENGGVP